MSTQHTPGPWEALPVSNWVVARDSNGGSSILIAELYPDLAKKPGALKADGRLIAAAPDLLAAAERALTEIDNLSGGIDRVFGDAGVVMAHLRAAIAKAKGESTDGL